MSKVVNMYTLKIEVFAKKKAKRPAIKSSNIRNDH